LDVVGVGDRTGPGEFRRACRVEQTPVRADAAFLDLPRLVVGFDDVVVDAERSGARNESANDLGLLGAARLSRRAVIAGARMSELRNHDVLTGVHAAQLAV